MNKFKSIERRERKLSEIAKNNYLKECKNHIINPENYLPSKLANEWLDCIKYLNSKRGK